jgi:hypothetical protein
MQPMQQVHRSTENDFATQHSNTLLREYPKVVLAADAALLP